MLHAANRYGKEGNALCTMIPTRTQIAHKSHTLLKQSGAAQGCLRTVILASAGCARVCIRSRGKQRRDSVVVSRHNKNVTKTLCRSFTQAGKHKTADNEHELQGTVYSARALYSGQWHTPLYRTCSERRLKKGRNVDSSAPSLPSPSRAVERARASTHSHSCGAHGYTHSHTIIAARLSILLARLSAPLSPANERARRPQRGSEKRWPPCLLTRSHLQRSISA